jgi:predicted glycoside hydrolase/deacetylase ChbG (UPF0249 family)/putative flippase GtrA
MALQIKWVADDFGFSRAANKSILSGIRSGSLHGVSVLANGLDVEFALRELSNSGLPVFVRLHINLTEGKSLLSREHVPLLTKLNGEFKYTPIRLLLAFLLTFGKRKRALMRQAADEVRAQRARLRSLGYVAALGVDGHQHVHMIPSVAKIVQQLHLEEEWDSVRVPKEVFFLPEKGTELHLLDVLRHTGLNILSFWNRKHFRSIPASSEAFIGSLITGRMYGHNIRRALCELSRTNVKVVECATHPGVNESQEVGAWSGDLVWHSHENRYKELGFILGPEYQKVMKEFGCEKGAECYSLVLQKTRFILAGLSATVTNLLVLYVSTEYVKMWYMASAVLAYIAATSISFYLQKYWTFHQGSRPYSKKEMALFFGNSSLAIVFSVYGLWLLVEHVGIWYMAAQIILIACIALWNFIFFKTYLFKSKSV